VVRDVDNTFFIIKHLINDNIMCINLNFGKLLNKSLSFIKGEELGNANTNKGCQVLEAGNTSA
jgi:hypothetical protein